MFKIKKIVQKVNENKMLILLATIVWISLNAIAEFKIFGSNSFQSESLPMDYQRIPMYYILTKTISYCMVIGFAFLSKYCILKAKNKDFIYNFLVPLFISFGILCINMLLLYPGIWWSDERIIYTMAMQYLPVYWHNYLTSLWHMVAFNIFPCPYAPILLINVLFAFLFSVIYKNSTTKKMGKRVYLLYLIFAPYILFTLVIGSRLSIYAILHGLLYMFLISEFKNNRSITVNKIVVLVLWGGLIAYWRSEGIIYLFFLPILIYLAYKKSINLKMFWSCAFGIVAVFFVLSIPQKLGERDFYNKDYFIPNTTRTLSVILSRNQEYENAEKDIENINTVISVDHIKQNYLDSSIFQQWNDVNNSGHLTQSASTLDEQKEYIKSYINLVYHNFDLFLWERFECFFEANGFIKIFNFLDSSHRNTEAIEPKTMQKYSNDVVNASKLQDEMFSGTLKANQNYLEMISFSNFQILWRLVNLVFPSIVVTLCLGIIMLIKKRYFETMLCVSLLSREAIVFLVRPDIRISYGITTIVTTYFIIIGLVALRSRKE